MLVTFRHVGLKLSVTFPTFFTAVRRLAIWNKVGWSGFDPTTSDAIAAIFWSNLLKDGEQSFQHSIFYTLSGFHRSLLLISFIFKMCTWNINQVFMTASQNLFQYIFHHFHVFIFSKEGDGDSCSKRTPGTSRSTAISDSSAGSTPRRDEARSEM